MSLSSVAQSLLRTPYFPVSVITNIFQKKEMPYVHLPFRMSPDGNTILDDDLRDWCHVVGTILKKKRIELHFVDENDRDSMWITFCYHYDGSQECLLKILKDCAAYSKIFKVWVPSI